jgi:uncharacterized lipoprotein YmbA
MSHRRKPPHAVAAILLAVLLAGCAGAAPPGYYTLAPIAPATAPAPAPTAASALISLGPVTLADYLDRRPIVTRDTAYALRLAENDFWAAPLQDMVPRVLVTDLAMRLPSDRIESFPQISASEGDYRIGVDISQFDIDATGLATLAARWRIYGRNATQPLLLGQETLQRQAEGGGYAGGVAALSLTLGDLSDRLAGAMTTLRQTLPKVIGQR